MPFEIVRNDITKMHVDAIVNTANPLPVIGSGTDSMIHAEAGSGLLRARKKIGPIPVGSAAVTDAYRLNARYVIHTVGPIWKGGTHNEEKLLRQCYDTCLQLALNNKCSSVAFPLISAGTYQFPKDRALQIAIAAFSSFLMEHEMMIYLVVFNREVFKLSEKLFHSVASFIDEHYVEEREKKIFSAPNRWRMDPQDDEFRVFSDGNLPLASRCPADEDEDLVFSYHSSGLSEDLREWDLNADGLPDYARADGFSGSNTHRRPASMPSAPLPASPIPSGVSLNELLRQTDASFTETLLKHIDRSGKKDSVIYNRANVTRQHFSKIRNNLAYKPTKPTAIAFAIALELDLAQTRDLIGRAGYALTNSSKFDVIIMYFIQNRNYDMVLINATLFEFDQPLLGV